MTNLVASYLVTSNPASWVQSYTIHAVPGRIYFGAPQVPGWAEFILPWIFEKLTGGDLQSLAF